MAKVEVFEDLDIWKLAREISNDTYVLFETTSLGKNYALSNQMDRSAGSIMDNIAEGFERNGNKEFIQYLSIAKASCGELRSQLYRAFDRNHISEQVFDESKKKVVLESKKISSFMSYLVKSEFKGAKYKR
jgi:four helix bundle protein